MDIDPMLLPEPFKTRILTYNHTLEICKSVKPHTIKTYKYQYDPEMKIPVKIYDKTEVNVVPLDTFIAT
jgi:hypothetical protein